MNLKVPEISGPLTTPKPWQIAVGVGVVAMVVFIAPAVMHELTTAKKKQDTVQLSGLGKIGEPWHPAPMPVALQAAPLRPPPQPLALPPPPPALSIPQSARPTATPSLAATGLPGKDHVDPEQEAINSPILIASGSSGPPPANHGATTGEGSGSLRAQGGDQQTALAGLLKPTETTGFRAERIPHPNMIIPQGTIIQCHSVTRMTSGLQGFVRATVARDVWSADDTTVLIEKDSTMFGEIQHGVIAGADRMFVLWRQITTPRPNLVRITLNSPAADEMGEAGLTGEVDHHFWEKVKGALLLSGIESVFTGASGALSNLGNHGNNNSENLNFGSFNSQGSTLATEMLRSTIQIPDTLTINQSAPCSAFVASDLDFSTVYDVVRKQ